MAGHWFKVEDQQQANANQHSYIYGVTEDVWGINADGLMQYRKGVTQTNHKGAEWIRTDN